MLNLDVKLRVASGVVVELCKTNVVTIQHRLEKTPQHCHILHIPCCNHWWYGCNTRSKSQSLTFQQFADNLFQFIIFGSWLAQRIDIVFDVYKDSSIKDAKKVRRDMGKLEFSSIIPTQKIQQWHSILSNGTIKTLLMAFLNEEWKKTYALFWRTTNFPDVQRNLFLLQWLSLGECKQFSFK